jgi:hypothetical protein
MGLLVGEDEHSQGWLAALLCCCAAVTDDEPVEKEKHKHRSGGSHTRHDPILLRD